jgi:hypothetical protein
MERVIKILMERDGESRETALELIDNFKQDLDDAIMSGDILECEELLALHFGLEPDYMEDFL